MSGNFAFVSDVFSGLLVYNVSVPWAPVLVGSYASPGNLYDVFVSGNFAYVCDHPTGLLVVNISVPWAPVLVGAYDIIEYPYGVFVSGDYAYVADYTLDFQVVEVQRNRYRQYATPATAQSLPVYAASSALVIQANLSVTTTLPSGTSISYELSADNGGHWEVVSVGLMHIFAYPGTSLRWRATLSRTDSLTTPRLEALTLTYTTKLTAPFQITPSDELITGDSTPTFNWSLLPGAVGYLLQVDTALTFDTPNLYNITGVTPPHIPAVSLTEAVWFWRVAGNDSTGLLGYYSDPWNFTIDTTSPTWDQAHTDHILDQVVELGTPFRYDLNASDPANLDTWWLNDTTHFTIDANGVITNNFALAVNDYGVQVWVNDTANNIQTATFTLTVQDTTAPTWVTLPMDQTLALGFSFTYNVSATDLDGIDHYWINLPAHFAIDATGRITNVAALSVGSYGVEVRAYDASNNYCSATFTITVETLDPPPGIPQSLIIGFAAGAVVFGILGVLGTIIYYRRRPS